MKVIETFKYLQDSIEEKIHWKKQNLQKVLALSMRAVLINGRPTLEEFHPTDYPLQPLITKNKSKES